MGALYLGPLTIKFELLFAVISILITYIVVKATTKKHKQIQKQLLESLFNGLMICVITYKFSMVLFRPSILFENPLGLLYFTGGLKGMILGIVLAIVYLFMKARKNQWATKIILEVIVYSIVTFALSFWLLRTLFYLFESVK